jgi:hypothetical protein
MTKDEALQICLEYIETDAHERRHVRWAIKEALVEEPPISHCAAGPDHCPVCHNEQPGEDLYDLAVKADNGGQP